MVRDRDGNRRGRQQLQQLWSQRRLSTATALCAIAAAVAISSGSSVLLTAAMTVTTNSAFHPRCESITRRITPVAIQRLGGQRIQQQQHQKQDHSTTCLRKKQFVSTRGSALCSTSTSEVVASLLDVSIDRPLFGNTVRTTAKSARSFSDSMGAAQRGSGGGILQSLVGSALYMFRSIKKLFKADGISLVAAAFCLVFLLPVLIGSFDTIFAAMSNRFKITCGHVKRFRDRRRREQLLSSDRIEPMPFQDDVRDGWGVCTLQSKRRLGKSPFVQYNFDLPEPDYTLPLDLGQQIKLCCLDNNNNVAQGDFFPFHPTAYTKPGGFSILATDHRSAEANIYAAGKDQANLCRVLKEDTRLGDEIALRPGEQRLEYRGQYLPVTDMVYLACGWGIVPVLDQIRIVLSSGPDTSVKSVSVVWINASTRDFDVTAEMLEEEYFKYSKKLTASCVVEDLQPENVYLEDNDEINAAVPDFQQGTMAVLSGPAETMKKATKYLEDRGYPTDTICVL